MKTTPAGKRKTKPAEAPTVSPPAWGVGPDLIRRCFLGLVTALIVARPLVLGEDLEVLLQLYGDASSLVLTFLWLALAAGWSLWRVWTGQRSWYASAVEGGLAAVVGVMFLSAAISARYKHPAWFIVWEWLALLVAFCLVRQMFRTAVDGQRLLAAMVATAVSLSAYAVYQYVYELPQHRERFQDEQALRKALAEEMPGQYDAGDLTTFRKRLEFDHVFGTYAHPNSFAGYLALLLPVAGGWTLVSWRQRRSPWLTYSLAACAALVGVGLWLTHSRGATLGTLLVLLALGAVRFRQIFLERKRLIGVAVLILVGGWLAFQAVSNSSGVEKSQRSLGLRRDYWIATWKMITDTEHPLQFLLGVGPGQFSRYYGRYMAPTAFEDLKDPHNFVLEIWASGGIFALLALLVALVAFFRAVWPTVRAPLPAEPASDVPGTPWEFYLGAMTGLLLAFMLFASSQTGTNKPDKILVGGVVAGFRSVIWFVAFALLERAPWTGPSRAIALTAGIAALLLNLGISGGISSPSVALLLWVAVALALNALPVQPVARTPHWWISGMVTPPLLACLAFGYLVGVLLPAADAVEYQQEAREYFLPYREEMAAGANKKPPAGDSDFARAGLLLRNHILPNLEKAVQAEPGEASLHAELAYWYEQRWVFSRNEEDRKLSLTEANRAVQLDPEGKEGYLARFQLHMLSAQQPVPNARDFYRQAVADLTQVVKRDPTRPALRYQLAEVHFLAGDAVEGRRQAREALDRDAMTTEPTRKLSDKQRQQAQQWVEQGEK